MGAMLVLAAAGCAHRGGASEHAAIESEGAFGSSAARLGPLAWARIHSILPGEPRALSWRPIAASGNVDVLAPPDVVDRDDAATIAARIAAGIDYLYPPERRPAPFKRIDVYLVPANAGVDVRRASLGRRGHLRLSFHLRYGGASPELVAYSVGTVVHEIVHVQRRLAGIAIDDEEEMIASVLEHCAVLSVAGEVSPTFNALAFESAASDRNKEWVASARAAATVANALPPIVRQGTEDARKLLESCDDHWRASLPVP